MVPKNTCWKFLYLFQGVRILGQELLPWGLPPSLLIQRNTCSSKASAEGLRAARWSTGPFRGWGTHSLKPTADENLISSLDQWKSISSVCVFLESELLVSSSTAFTLCVRINLECSKPGPYCIATTCTRVHMQLHRFCVCLLGMR